MARKNRVVLRDATYHVTSRVANGDMLLRDASFKDEIARWIHGVARFSGVEVYTWCVMDNHIHVVVHVPGVPSEYWIDPDAEPDSHAFGMRPAENRVQRWEPRPATGDCPLDGVESFRPEVGFSLPDEDMLDRLLALYGDRGRIEAMRRSWEAMRKAGNGYAVDAVKERYARRMYNVSQYVKTLKERISQAYNRRTGHIGSFWQGRFHSGVVESSAKVRGIVAAYVDYNAVRAGIVADPSDYRWCGFGAASGGGELAAESRSGYEKMLGVPWESARAAMSELFARKERKQEEGEAGADARADGSPEGVHGRLRDVPKPITKAIRFRIPVFASGVYIGVDRRLATAVVAGLPKGFPLKSFARAVDACRKFDWEALFGAMLSA